MDWKLRVQLTEFENKILICEGEGFEVNPLVLEKLDLTNGHVVDTETKRVCVILNVTAVIARLRLQKIAGEEVPQLCTWEQVLLKLTHGAQE